MNARAVTIYSLCDTREADPVLQVRYIGQTSDSLRRRFCHHVCMAQRGGMTHRERWMRSVWAGGGHVVAKVLAVVPPERWSDAEREEIARYRSLGARLTNHTDGGEGMLNPTQDTRQKLRDAFIGQLSAETRAKMSAARKGRKHAPEHAARISAAKKAYYANRMAAR